MNDKIADMIWTIDSDETSWSSRAEAMADAPASPFMIDMIASYMTPHQSWAIDVGCGTGRAFLPLAEAGYWVIGLDPNVNGLHLSLQRVNRAHLPAYPVLASAVRFPVPASSAAFIIAFSTLFHPHLHQHREDHMRIENEHLANSVVLEIGSGRGDTSRRLVDLLSGQPDAQLIITDISDTFFQQLRDEFRTRDVQIQFVLTGAHELHGIPNKTVDYIVCNYTLCAVNSQAGLVALALQRFWEVLKDDGKLFVEEEFPVSKQDTPAQEIWAEKWRILKSAMILAGKFPYNEIDPGTLEGLCRLAGFEDTRWTAHAETFCDANVLDFFQKRLDALVTQMPNESLRAGFSEMAVRLHDKAIQVGAMEIPFYRLTARKRAG